MGNIRKRREPMCFILEKLEVNSQKNILNRSEFLLKGIAETTNIAFPLDTCPFSLHIKVSGCSYKKHFIFLPDVFSLNFTSAKLPLHDL